MRYLSLCSGIEAASVAWERLGWTPVAFSEIDPFPAAVLKHRFPDVPNWGDMTKFEEWPDACICVQDHQQCEGPIHRTKHGNITDHRKRSGRESRAGNSDRTCKRCGGINAPIDLICGGTPCQSFSVAGLRKGLDDERGNLMLTFGHILAKYRPGWFVWENVPGVLSSNDGRDFASFLGLVTGQGIEPPDDGLWRTGGALSGIGSAYGIAWRVIDAQFTRSDDHPRAVPQRRRRVFVVGHLGDWRRAAAVLFDSESVSRNPPPSRKAGQRVAGTLKGGSGERGYPDPSDGNGGGLVEIRGSHWDGGAHPPLTQSHNTGGIAMSNQELFAQRGAGLVAARESGQGFWMDDDIAGTIDANMGSSGHKERPAIIAHVYENHPQDSRITEMDGVCSTVHSKYGTGGGNVPLVAMSSGQANAEISVDKSPSLTCLHEAPIVAIQGTIIGRSDKAGPQGSGVNEDGAMFTLTKADQHAIAIRTANTNANGHRIAEDVAHTLDQAQGQAVAFQQNTRDEVRLMNGDGQIAGALSAEAGMKQQNYIAFDARQSDVVHYGDKTGPLDTDGTSVAVAFDNVARSLTARHDSSPCADRGMDIIAQETAVRRLLPVECERLQGFPDGWTDIPWRGKPNAPDGPRYKAIGNSMAVNVMEWIGRRIKALSN